ncbi:MAG: hypothetical protein WC781_01235 [Candidatus Pacearchaeota archaeon]|jgi:hypothetical protein
MTNGIISIHGHRICENYDRCSVPKGVTSMINGQRETNEPLVVHYNLECLQRGENCELNKTIGELR